MFLLGYIVAWHVMYMLTMAQFSSEEEKKKPSDRGGDIVNSLLCSDILILMAFWPKWTLPIYLCSFVYDIIIVYGVWHFVANATPALDLLSKRFEILFYKLSNNNCAPVYFDYIRIFLMSLSILTLTRIQWCWSVCPFKRLQINQFSLEVTIFVWLY